MARIKENQVPSAKEIYLNQELKKSELIPSKETSRLFQILSKNGLVNTLLFDFEQGDLSGSRSLQFKEPKERIFDSPISMGLAKDVLDDLGLEGVVSLKSESGEVDRYGNELKGDMAKAISYQWFPKWLRGPDFNENEKNLKTEKLLKMQKDVKEAEIRLTNANLRLVVSVAKNYPQDKNMDITDHISNGNIGLIKAVRKFDWRKGYEFSTYAMRWINQGINRNFKENKSAIHIPHHIQYSVKRVESAYEKVKEESGDSEIDPDLKRVVDLVNEGAKRGARLTLETVDFILNEYPRLKNMYSLNAPIERDTDRTLEETIKDKAIDPSTQAEEASTRDKVNKILEVLPERERRVLILRYNLDGGGVRTLEEVGKEFSLTRERIRQLEAKALGRIKRPMRRLDDELTETPIFLNAKKELAFEDLSLAELIKLYSQKGLNEAAGLFGVTSDEFYQRMRLLTEKAS
jgi:RNA polymerase sigma factor (sigma-70 family)